jgi:hypothetical protein
MQDRLAAIFRDLHSRNPLVCGSAPEWIIQQVECRLAAVLADLSPADQSEKIKEFVLGAVHYIDDQCGHECDTLGDALYKLITQ